MCLFTSARTVAIVFARSAGSEAMYCAGVLTFDGGFMDSSSFPNEVYHRTSSLSEKRWPTEPQALIRYTRPSKKAARPSAWLYHGFLILTHEVSSGEYRPWASFATIPSMSLAQTTSNRHPSLRCGPRIAPAPAQ